jgi:hypothetical protein
MHEIINLERERSEMTQERAPFADERNGWEQTSSWDIHVRDGYQERKSSDPITELLNEHLNNWD